LQGDNRRIVFFTAAFPHFLSNRRSRFQDLTSVFPFFILTNPLTIIIAITIIDFMSIPQQPISLLESLQGVSEEGGGI
jgi:hypothetical protein